MHDEDPRVDKGVGCSSAGSTAASHEAKPTVRAALILRPMSLREARAWVTIWHRHHETPQGGKFALSAWRDDRPTMPQETLCGVAIVGRPVSRALDDGLTAEVIRVATDGSRNACSFLYGAAKRAAQAMGYRKVVTYTLVEESGASLRAVGWTRAGLTDGGSWRCAARPHAKDSHPLQQKIRWETTDTHPASAAVDPVGEPVTNGPRA